MMLHSSRVTGGRSCEQEVSESPFRVEIAQDSRGVMPLPTFLMVTSLLDTVPE